MVNAETANKVHDHFLWASVWSNLHLLQKKNFRRQLLIRSRALKHTISLLSITKWVRYSVSSLLSFHLQKSSKTMWMLWMWATGWLWLTLWKWYQQVPMRHYEEKKCLVGESCVFVVQWMLHLFYTRARLVAYLLFHVIKSQIDNPIKVEKVECILFSGTGGDHHLNPLLLKPEALKSNGSL